VDAGHLGVVDDADEHFAARRAERRLADSFGDRVGRESCERLELRVGEDAGGVLDLDGELVR